MQIAAKKFLPNFLCLYPNFLLKIATYVNVRYNVIEILNQKMIIMRIIMKC